jgi:hypothetical protein
VTLRDIGCDNDQGFVFPRGTYNIRHAHLAFTSFGASALKMYRGVGWILGYHSVGLLYSGIESSFSTDTWVAADMNDKFSSYNCCADIDGVYNCNIN